MFSTLKLFLDYLVSLFRCNWMINQFLINLVSSYIIFNLIIKVVSRLNCLICLHVKGPDWYAKCPSLGLKYRVRYQCCSFFKLLIFICGFCKRGLRIYFLLVWSQRETRRKNFFWVRKTSVTSTFLIRLRLLKCTVLNWTLLSLHEGPPTHVKLQRNTSCLYF